MSEDKIKIVTLGDLPLVPSGVAIQSKYMITGLLDRYEDKYEFVSLGGGKEHENYNPVQPSGYEEDWIIYPVDGYGDPNTIRSTLRSEKPDILWFMTDPRFYEWLWNMEDEVRAQVPMVYYNIWDNYPYPEFNNVFYESTDVLVSISELTRDINQTVAPDVDQYHIPHTVDFTAYRPHSKIEKEKFTDEPFWKENFEDKFVFFYNGKNARRKQTASMIYWFKQFLDKHDLHDDASFLMHTEPRAEEGGNLIRIVNDLDLDDGQVVFSTDKMPAENLALIYNCVDCTLQLSDAEGFGVPVCESLACETPVIGTDTGGIPDQLTDGDETFGRLVEPASQSIVGSQRVPYIFEDRLATEDVVEAMEEIYFMDESDRNELGEKGKEYVRDKFSTNKFIEKWDSVLTETHEKYGSWPNEQYERWVCEEI